MHIYIFLRPKALTGLLFCVGEHRLISRSCVCSYSVFASFFVVKSGKKLSSKPGCKKVAAKLETKKDQDEKEVKSKWAAKASVVFLLMEM